MATIPREFYDFLKTVDGEVERPQDFLRLCAGAFMANSATDQFDLIGFDMVDCKRGVSICGCIAWLLMSILFCQVQSLMLVLGHLCVARFPKQMRGVLLQYFLFGQVRKLICAGWRRAWRIGCQLAVMAATEANQWGLYSRQFVTKKQRFTWTFLLFCRFVCALRLWAHSCIRLCA
jgi:hypothetical protein